MNLKMNTLVAHFFLWKEQIKALYAAGGSLIAIVASVLLVAVGLPLQIIAHQGAWYVAILSGFAGALITMLIENLTVRGCAALRQIKQRVKDTEVENARIRVQALEAMARQGVPVQLSDEIKHMMVFRLKEAKKGGRGAYIYITLGVLASLAGNSLFWDAILLSLPIAYTLSVTALFTFVIPTILIDSEIRSEIHKSIITDSIKGGDEVIQTAHDADTTAHIHTTVYQKELELIQQGHMQQDLSSVASNRLDVKIDELLGIPGAARILRGQVTDARIIEAQTMQRLMGGDMHLLGNPHGSNSLGTASFGGPLLQSPGQSGQQLQLTDLAALIQTAVRQAIPATSSNTTPEQHTTATLQGATGYQPSQSTAMTPRQGQSQSHDSHVAQQTGTAMSEQDKLVALITESIEQLTGGQATSTPTSATTGMQRPAYNPNDPATWDTQPEMPVISLHGGHGNGQSQVLNTAQTRHGQGNDGDSTSSATVQTNRSNDVHAQEGQPSLLAQLPVFLESILGRPIDEAQVQAWLARIAVGQSSSATQQQGHVSSMGYVAQAAANRSFVAPTVQQGQAYGSLGHGSQQTQLPQASSHMSQYGSGQGSSTSDSRMSQDIPQQDKGQRRTPMTPEGLRAFEAYQRLIVRGETKITGTMLAQEAGIAVSTAKNYLRKIREMGTTPLLAALQEGEQFTENEQDETDEDASRIPTTPLSNAHQEDGVVHQDSLVQEEATPLETSELIHEEVTPSESGEFQEEKDTDQLHEQDQPLELEDTDLSQDAMSNGQQDGELVYQ